MKYITHIQYTAYRICGSRFTKQNLIILSIIDFRSVGYQKKMVDHKHVFDDHVSDRLGKKYTMLSMFPHLDAAEEDDVDEDACEAGHHLLGLVVVEAREGRQAEDHNVEHRNCLRKDGRDSFQFNELQSSCT